ALHDAAQREIVVGNHGTRPRNFGAGAVGVVSVKGDDAELRNLAALFALIKFAQVLFGANLVVDRQSGIRIAFAGVGRERGHAAARAYDGLPAVFLVRVPIFGPAQVVGFVHVHGILAHGVP